MQEYYKLKDQRFLSTPSARRATTHLQVDDRGDGNFYPRPPRGGRPVQAEEQQAPVCNFYPRPPRGGRHRWTGTYSTAKRISIHALREEGDLFRHVCCGNTSYFYPRPPRGGRLDLAVHVDGFAIFLSTPSARRATFYLQPCKRDLHISIHALREEGDAFRPDPDGQR